jgi:hypothetical protein
MAPENKSISDTERTQELPAQEKVASGDQVTITLSAEQVYAQRFSEVPLDESVQIQGFIP